MSCQFTLIVQINLQLKHSPSCSKCQNQLVSIFYYLLNILLSTSIYNTIPCLPQSKHPYRKTGHHDIEPCKPLRKQNLPRGIMKKSSRHKLLSLCKQRSITKGILPNSANYGNKLPNVKLTSKDS